MSNIQKINQTLTLDQGARLQLAHTAVTAVEITTPLEVRLVQTHNTFSGQDYLPYLYGNEPVERGRAGDY